MNILLNFLLSFSYAEFLIIYFTLHKLTKSHLIQTMVSLLTPGVSQILQLQVTETTQSNSSQGSFITRIYREKYTSQPQWPGLTDTQVNLLMLREGLASRKQFNKCNVIQGPSSTFSRMMMMMMALFQQLTRISYSFCLYFFLCVFSVFCLTLEFPYPLIL